MRKTFKSLCLLLSVVMLTAVLSPVRVQAVSRKEADTAGFISRNDGMWLWPLPRDTYNSVTDWSGCRGGNTCAFHATAHSGCAEVDSEHSGLGHCGIDIGVAEGTPVYASADGILYCTSTDWASRGVTAVMEHAVGNGWSYYSVYQHLDQAVLTLDGKNVSAGTCIAYSGKTDGHGTGKEQLHFEILMAGSGKGYAMSRDPNRELDAVEDKGWLLKDDYGVGRVMTNPALNSPAGYPKGASSDVVESLKMHAGSVMYTFYATDTWHPVEVYIPFEVTLENMGSDTSGAVITPPEGGWQAGSNTFTVTCAQACTVAISRDGGATYTRLKADSGGTGNTHSFTADMSTGTLVGVILTGDSNGDGNITNADITRMCAAYAGKITITPLQQLAVDVNGSGDVTNADITRLCAAYAGKVVLSW